MTSFRPVQAPARATGIRVTKRAVIPGVRIIRSLALSPFKFCTVSELESDFATGPASASAAAAEAGDAVGARRVVWGADSQVSGRSCGGHEQLECQIEVSA